MAKLVQEEELEVYKPQFQTEPRIYYANLYRFTHCFIAGSVALKDVDECADGAQITLKRLPEGTSFFAETNNYGDFKIDGLEKKSGQYSLKVSYPGYQAQEMNINLTTSINVGIVLL